MSAGADDVGCDCEGTDDLLCLGGAEGLWLAQAALAAARPAGAGA